jgi:hypothetical protein
MGELAPTEFALIPVTTREAYSDQHIYQILIDRLARLEHMLVGRGFEGPITRIQFHLRILEKLRLTPGIADDQTLWSLVEATELADIYCSLPRLEWRLLKEKFGRVLNGPLHPQEETSESNLARNTMFELHLSGYLNHKGIAADICDNPDISCAIGGRHVFIQCKRPFSRKSIMSNIRAALGQLSKDLNEAHDVRNRGVVAVSLSHAVNPSEMHMQVKTERDINSAIMSVITPICKSTYHLLKGPRIVGISFGVTVPVFVSDIKEFRTGQVNAFYASSQASDSDRVLLRNLFQGHSSRVRFTASGQAELL